MVLEQSAVLAEIGLVSDRRQRGDRAARTEPGLMRAVGVKPQSYDYRDLHRQDVMRAAGRAAGRYGAPMYNIHRADLVDMQLDAVPPGEAARRAM